jgi:hypothetical protein
MWAQKQPPPSFNFCLAIIFCFTSVPKSHIQMGSLSVQNASSKLSRLGTFKVRDLKVMGNEKGGGGSGSKLLLEYGFGLWPSMSI